MPPRGRGLRDRQGPVIDYTKTAALELPPHNIRLNVLAPDLTMAEGLLRISPDGLRRTPAT
ncbi:NAD(P)-dependent dehydrogenase (short-subunit alcohol dehydrogenase family) [Mycobacterium sp. URHB0021]